MRVMKGSVYAVCISRHTKSMSPEVLTAGEMKWADATQGTLVNQHTSDAPTAAAFLRTGLLLSFSCPAARRAGWVTRNSNRTIQ